MPTYDFLDRFWREYHALPRARQALFDRAVAKLVADLRAGRLRKGLRIKAVQGHTGVWELTWAPDGRATFMYGTSPRPGDKHVIWLRIGGHEIFDDPGASDD